MEINVEKISFGYKEVRVIKSLSFILPEGEFAGIAGPNGAGKTTLLKILDGILKPQEGKVTLNGKDIREFNRKELARCIAYVSQEHELPFAFTVEEAVLMGRYPHLGLLGFEGEKDVKIAEEAMEFCGISHLKNRLVTELSGGERQRTVIARAIAQQTPVLLLDEPTAHLDLSGSVEIFELLLKLQKEKGLTIVSASHDLNLLARYTRRIMFLWKGEKILDGTPEEVLNEELLSRVYGARFHILQDLSVGRPVIVPGEQGLPKP